MNVLQAIKIINRRATTLKNLFGAHSDFYEEFTTEMTNYEFYTNKKGIFQLNANKANKSEYRKLTAWATRIQKTPFSVLKRKSDKLKREFFDDEFYDFEDYNTDDDIKDLDTYYKWLQTFKDYFESCYDLARRNGFEGRAAYEYADELYNSRPDYVRQWNYFYKTGAFDEFKKSYETQQIKQEYDIDENSGDMTEKSNFYRGL